MCYLLLLAIQCDGKHTLHHILSHSIFWVGAPLYQKKVQNMYTPFLWNRTKRKSQLGLHIHLIPPVRLCKAYTTEATGVGVPFRILWGTLLLPNAWYSCSSSCSIPSMVGLLQIAVASALMLAYSHTAGIFIQDLTYFYSDSMNYDQIRVIVH